MDPMLELFKTAEDQLEKGKKIEREHRGTIRMLTSKPKTTVEEATKSIAKDHLQEDKKYYDHLEEMEQEHVKQAQVEAYQQETQWTCSAAALRAVLLHYGDDWPEKVLVPLIGARPQRGAETTEIAEAARALGYDVFEYSFASVAHAKLLLDQDIPIICDIQSFKYRNKGHYVVMTKVDDAGVHLMDPNVPEEGNVRVIPIEDMEGRWWDLRMKGRALMRRWGIVILPKEQTKVALQLREGESLTSYLADEKLLNPETQKYLEAATAAQPRFNKFQALLRRVKGHPITTLPLRKTATFGMLGGTGKQLGQAYEASHEPIRNALVAAYDKSRLSKGIGAAARGLFSDVPGTPHLFMKSRTPEQLAGVGMKARKGADAIAENMINMAADHPEILPMQGIPIPGLTPAYLAGKAVYKVGGPRAAFRAFAEKLRPKKVPQLEMAKAAAELRTKLEPHQQRVVDRMQQDDQPGLVVAHGLGSGKTLTSIAAQEALKMPASVVVPASLGANYQKEVKKHLKGRGQPRHILSMQNMAMKGIVPQDPMMIVDEAHRAREPATKTYKTLAKNKAEKRMLLTGSPFYNHPSDVSPLVNLAAGGKVLPMGKEDFSKRYISSEKVKPGLWGRLRGIQPGEREVVNPRTAPELKRTLKKWVDYHPGTTENFPEVTREDIKVPMHPKQQQMYDAMLGQAPPWVAYKIRQGLPPSKQESQQLNAFMQAVRQISNTTAPFHQEGQAYDPKIEAAYGNLKKNLDENPRSKALVFSNYLDAGVNPYKQRLEKDKVPYGEFTGALSKTKREELVQQYNTGQLRALLLSSAGGEGLDTKGTRLIQLLEPHWNAEKLNQAEGRGIRYMSHADLPPEERKVLVQRYLATRSPKGVLQKLHLKKPGGGADEYLAQLSQDKENLIKQFRGMLAEPPKEQPHA